MSLKVTESLARQVVVAHRIVETIVLRSRAGEVFTVDIGTPLSLKTGSALGAKVTQVSTASKHLAVCLAPTMEEVFELAQRHIAEAIEEAAADTAERRAA